MYFALMSSAKLSELFACVWEVRIICSYVNGLAISSIPSTGAIDLTAVPRHTANPTAHILVVNIEPARDALKFTHRVSLCHLTTFLDHLDLQATHAAKLTTRCSNFYTINEVVPGSVSTVSSRTRFTIKSYPLRIPLTK